MPRVFIPSSLRRHTSGETSIDLPGRSVRELIDQLDDRYPGLRGRLCDGDRLKAGFAVAIDSRISDLGLMQKVPLDSEVHFVSSVGGG